MRVLAVFLSSVVLLGAMIFVPAGRLDYAPGWICLVALVVGFSAVTIHAARRTPSLLRRRRKVGAGTPAWDLVFVFLFQLFFVGILVLGGLDSGRYGWTSLPRWLQGSGLVLMTAGTLLLGWAMGQNPHFETTVRIQTDQQHRVIDTGPYRIVRHPGYVAAFLILIATALMLDSAWALFPAVLGVVALILRTAKEDHFLQENLPGYRTYAGLTRYRLVPGIW